MAAQVAAGTSGAVGLGPSFRPATSLTSSTWDLGWTEASGPHSPGAGNLERSGEPRIWGGGGGAVGGMVRRGGLSPGLTEQEQLGPRLYRTCPGGVWSRRANGGYSVRSYLCSTRRIKSGFDTQGRQCTTVESNPAEATTASKDPIYLGNGPCEFGPERRPSCRVYPPGQATPRPPSTSWSPRTSPSFRSNLLSHSVVRCRWGCWRRLRGLSPGPISCETYRADPASTERLWSVHLHNHRPPTQYLHPLHSNVALTHGLAPTDSSSHAPRQSTSQQLAAARCVAISHPRTWPDH